MKILVDGVMEELVLIENGVDSALDITAIDPNIKWDKGKEVNFCSQETFKWWKNILSVMESNIDLKRELSDEEYQKIIDLIDDDDFEHTVNQENKLLNDFLYEKKRGPYVATFSIETPASIETELKNAVKQNLADAPVEIAEPVNRAANDLFGEMYQLSATENEYGASGAWDEFKANKTEIKDELHALGSTLQQSKEIAGQLIAHTVELGSQKVVGAFQKGCDFMRSHQQQICLRTPQESLAADLAEMEKLRQRLGKYIENAPQEMQPELEKVRESWEEFSGKVRRVQNIENSPLIENDSKSFSKIFLNIGEKVREVRQSVQDFPTAMNTAVKDKSNDLLNKACSKMLSVFDKAINFLDKQRKRIMGFIPDAKLDRNASPEKIYFTHSENAVLYDPALSGKELDMQIVSNLMKGGYSERKIKECIAQSPEFKNLPLKEKTAQISNLVKGVKFKELSYSR